MNVLFRPLVVFALATLLLCHGLPAAHAIVVMRAGGEGRNLSAPTGEWRNSGWQYEGAWSGFTGTAIGPHHFLTATHVGGQVGAAFLYRGVKYPATGWHPIPNTDMTVWWVEGTLPDFAPLYDKGEETNQQIVLFGRGTQRGEPVTINGKLRGWRWGKNDGQLSWGVNRVITTTYPPSMLPGTEMLTFVFGPETGDPNTGSLSPGDSGGGAFIRDNGVWKLAGINHGTDGGYRTQSSGGVVFGASLFDARGLYRILGENNTLWLGDATAPEARCSVSYCARVSSNVAAIRQAMQTPPQRFARRTIALFAASIFAAFCGVVVVVKLLRRRPRVSRPLRPR